MVCTKSPSIVITIIVYVHTLYFFFLSFLFEMAMRGPGSVGKLGFGELRCSCFKHDMITILTISKNGWLVGIFKLLSNHLISLFLSL